MTNHAQDKRHARDLITKVLAADCTCAPGDLVTDGTTFSLAREIPGRRRYPLLDSSLLIVTTGYGVAIAASEGRLEWLRTQLAARGRDAVFAATTIVELADLVAPDNQVIIGPTVSYACSRDTFQPPPAPHDVEIAITEHGAIPALYAYPGFDHALAYRTRVDRQDRIAAVAHRAGEIVGIAACSDDAEALWQIGIDVLPVAQGSGIGRALVSGLTARILEDGRVPFYTAAASNIASCSLALGLG